MNEKSLRILEYPKIIEMLAEHAGSEEGKQKCRNLLPSCDLSLILKGQMETSDALARIYKNGSLSFGGVRDVRAALLRLKVGASISMTELLHIASLLETVMRVRQYGKRAPEDEDRDSLDPMFSALEPLTPLVHEIRRCILDEDTVADDASPALKSVRRQIRQTNDKIRTQLSAMITSQAVGSKLQDSLVTMRNGRYCLPVKAEYRSQVPGMIHDQSSSGATLFIEPMSVVKLNNDLSQLAAKEKEEIGKVLDLLSEQAADAAPAIQSDYSLMTELDFIFAKASFSRSYRGTEPVFNEDGIIHLKKARHPLLDRKKAVPIDIELGDSFQMLIVTGPNTGGKTVSLKTAGLLTLMGQAGLHIPAFEHSKLSVFQSIYADIGDEQSIEQSLSTFSSHMTNIVDILGQAGPGSLVLLDELCAGTDPVEGAALAVSILRKLLGDGVSVMATTHYSELKVFAMTTDRVCNASCEFDVATLSPTYRLLIGIPGKSNAFAISGKLGLPEEIIDAARQSIDVQQQNFEDLLSDLEANRLTIEKEQAEIEQYRDEVEKLKKKLETKQINIDQQKQKILDDAREKARNILQDAKDYADHTIRTVNKLSSKNGVDMKALEKERTAIRNKLDQSGGKKKKAPEAVRAAQSRPEDFHKGDSVRVVSMNLKGTIISDVNNSGEFMVQMGIMKSHVHYSDLVLTAEELEERKKEKRDSSGSGKIRMEKSMAAASSINLIGQTVDEAMINLKKYLDDAYLAKLDQVTIIHGRGTGALRKAVQERLRKTKYVKSFRAGMYGEGETGVTIVEFKRK